MLCMHRSFQDRKDSQVSMIWGSRNIFLYKSKAQYALCSLVPLYVSLVFSRFFCCCLFVLGFVLLCFFFSCQIQNKRVGGHPRMNSKITNCSLVQVSLLPVLQISQWLVTVLGVAIVLEQMEGSEFVLLK